MSVDQGGKIRMCVRMHSGLMTTQTYSVPERICACLASCLALQPSRTRADIRTYQLAHGELGINEWKNGLVSHPPPTLLRGPL